MHTLIKPTMFTDRHPAPPSPISIDADDWAIDEDYDYDRLRSLGYVVLVQSRFGAYCQRLISHLSCFSPLTCSWAVVRSPEFESPVFLPPSANYTRELQEALPFFENAARAHNAPTSLLITYIRVHPKQQLYPPRTWLPKEPTDVFILFSSSFRFLETSVPLPSPLPWLLYPTSRPFHRWSKILPPLSSITRHFSPPIPGQPPAEAPNPRVAFVGQEVWMCDEKDGTYRQATLGPIVYDSSHPTTRLALISGDAVLQKSQQKEAEKSCLVTPASNIVILQRDKLLHFRSQAQKAYDHA